jgi:NADH-quinone oxidoreductase subunit M
VSMLRMFIRSMHNRVGPKVESYDVSLGYKAVLVPLVLVIIALAVYPQVALKRSQATVYSIVGDKGGLVAQQQASPPLTAARTP